MHGLPSTHAYLAVGANLGCSFAKLYSTDDKVSMCGICLRDIRLGHVIFQSHLKLPTMGILAVQELIYDYKQKVYMCTCKVSCSCWEGFVGGLLGLSNKIAQRRVL